MEKLNKLSLPITILVASLILGGAYFASQVMKQRSIERQQEIKIEQEKQTKEQAGQALDTCIANAEENYSYQWEWNCKRTFECESLNEITFDEYIKQNNIPPDDSEKVTRALFDWAEEGPGCSCNLSPDRADKLNNSLRDDKNECFKRYQQ